MPNSARQQVAFDFNLKLIFERDFRMRITAFNEKLILAYTKSVARFESVPDFGQFQAELERILDRHFHKVGDAFTDKINEMVAQELGEKKLTLVTEIKHRIPVIVSSHFKVRALSEATKITATTNAQAITALREAQRLATDPSVLAIEQVNVASQSSAVFRRRLNGRISGIIRLNTNEPAEAAKLTQIQILRGEEPTLAGGTGTDGTKSWANQGDSLVRIPPDSKFNHIAAEQTVALDKPFNVSGQLLRYPGDTSLGASLGNIVNCRCSVTYNINETAKKIRSQR